MKKKVNSTTGRLLIMTMVIGSAVLAFIILFVIGRGGAIAGEGIGAVINELLEIYLPLIAFMTAFYFGQTRILSNDDKTSLETFVFSVLTIGLWVFCPPILIYFGEAIEDVLNTIHLLKPYGETIAAAGVAFYFAKS